MSDIVQRLRTWTHSVHAVPVSDMLDEAADEIDRLRLAAAEREAVSRAAKDASDFGYADTAATLRSLLERLSPPAT